MLNNITNFFNLIQTGMVKSQLESADLLPVGTRDSRYGGNYKPTMIKYSDLAAQILAGVPPLTIGTTPIASGTVGKLLYEGVGNVLNESPVFNIDPLTGFLGAGTTTPQFAIDMQYNSLGFYSGPTYYASLGLNNGSFYLTSYSDFVFGTSVVGNPLTIKQNGNVLINTGTDAGYKLDVNGTSRYSGIARFQNTSSNWLNIDGSSSGTNNCVISNRFNQIQIVTNTGAGDPHISLLPATGGNVGIGTSSPTRSLDTTGSIRVGGTFIYGDTNNQYLQLSNVHGTFLGYNTSNIAIVASSVRLIANGVEVLRAFQTGNVLIGTTTDAGYKLDVVGTARISNATWDGTALLLQGPSPGKALHVLANSQVLFESPLTMRGSLINFYEPTGLAAATTLGEITSGGAHWNASNVTRILFAASGGTWSGSSKPTKITFSTTNVGNITATEKISIEPSGNLLINTTTDVASSLVTIESTTKGFLPPRMTTTQKNAIATPAAGLMVYDNTLNRPCFYNGTSWITL